MNFDVPRRRYGLLDIMVKNLCISSHRTTHHIPSSLPPESHHLHTIIPPGWRKYPPSKAQHLDRDRQAEIRIADRVLSSADSRIHLRPVVAVVAGVVAAGSNERVAHGRVGRAGGGHARAAGCLAHINGDLTLGGVGVGQAGAGVAGSLVGAAGGHVGVGGGAAHGVGGVAAPGGQRGALRLVGVAPRLAGGADSAACGGRGCAVADVVGGR